MAEIDIFVIKTYSVFSEHILLVTLIHTLETISTTSVVVCLQFIDRHISRVLLYNYSLLSHVHLLHHHFFP